MATAVQVTIRRDEAYRRIEQGARTLAKGLGTRSRASIDQRHRDPAIEQVLRIEAIAELMDELVKAQGKGSERGQGTAPGGNKFLGPVEEELEAETGHDVVKTSDDPVTFVETDKPAPKAKSK